MFTGTSPGGDGATECNISHGSQNMDGFSQRHHKGTDLDSMPLIIDINRCKCSQGHQEGTGWDSVTPLMVVTMVVHMGH